MRTFFIILSIGLLSTAQGSFPEFFGTGPSTTGLGNQANMDPDDPANSYYVPALHAFSNTVSLSASASNVNNSFTEINNIVVTNSTNSSVSNSTDVTTGNALTDYGSFQASSFHFAIPIRLVSAGSMSFSLFTPINKLVETNTGSPDLPEYVLFHARYKRFQLMANYSHPLNKVWGISLGAHLGQQAAASFQSQASLGDNYGSSGATKMVIKPSVGGIFSVVAKRKKDFYYFTYQQEMKSNFEATAFGDITDPPLALINIGIKSMMYYDPHIFRLGHGRDFSSLALKVYLSIEYQLWGNYETPIVRIINRGGAVRSSSNYEKIKTRNIFYPRLGLDWRPHDQFSYKLGIAYRQTPLKGNFQGAGNSLDANTLITSLGLAFDTKVFNFQTQLGLTGQYHLLKESKVIKSDGQENGKPGQKIGAPGFTIGGSAILATMGIKVLF